MFVLGIIFNIISIVTTGDYLPGIDGALEEDSAIYALAYALASLS